MNLEFWQIAALFIGGLFIGTIIGHRKGTLWTAENAARDITNLLSALDKRLCLKGLNGKEEIEAAMVDLYGKECEDYLAANRKPS